MGKSVVWTPQTKIIQKFFTVAKIQHFTLLIGALDAINNPMSAHRETLQKGLYRPNASIPRLPYTQAKKTLK